MALSDRLPPTTSQSQPQPQPQPQAHSRLLLHPDASAVQATPDASFNASFNANDGGSFNARGGHALARGQPQYQPPQRHQQQQHQQQQQQHQHQQQQRPPSHGFGSLRQEEPTPQKEQPSGSQPPVSQSYQHIQNTRPADTIPRHSLEALPPSPRGARGPPLAPHAPPEVSSNHFTAPRQPYLASTSSQAPRHISESVSYYSAQHHPYSTATAQSGYAPTGGPEIMAATHAMRAPGPTMYSHQSASPVSAHSPHEPHNRIYGYNVNQHYYGPSHTPNYIAHPPPIQQPPSLAPRPTYPIQYSQPPPLQNHSQPQPASIISSPARTSVAQSPISQLKYPQISQSPSFPPSANLQPASQVSPTSAQNNAAAPGPIPATTPLVIKQDSNGVQWIMFEYSRDRVKVQYEIRCDVESVDVKKLPKEHKDQNCVYPRACNKDSYQGNRLDYESQCNEVGWALAWLNPTLQGKRGLIQRAVDSWRNSNANQKLRSRRVRRLAKNQKRTLAQQQIQSGGQVAVVTSTSPVKNSLQSTHGQIQSGGNGNASHHHHLPSESGSQAEHMEASARGETRTHSPTEVRFAQSFRPVYPVSQGVGEGGQAIRDGPNNANQMNNSTTITASLPNPEHVNQAAILGDLPYGSKPRKNMTVKDRQKDAQTRIIVRLDEMATDDIPDNHRLKNSVFPRSYYSRQRESVPLDDAEDSDTSPVVAKTQVQIRLEDGWAVEFPVPKMRKSKRQRERMLNDFGCHIMWGGNIRHFDNRPLFLQQALNVFRRDVEDKSTKAGRPVSPLWQIRPGKRKWMERSKNVKQEDDV